MSDTRDALANIVRAHNNYRVLAPQRMTDPNGNRSEVAFDALGLVVATAVKGKVNENLGDLLEDFDPDPSLAILQTFVADPRGQAASMLGKATTRIVYDLDRFRRSSQPTFAATLARETHFFASGGPQTKIQVSFSYADGFGREMQKKLQAERGTAPQRGPNVTLPSGDVRPGALVRDVDNKPIQADAPQRWVGSGRTVFNNKGKPVKQYEPFFSAIHLYEEEREMTDTGVSPVLFYDPVERVVATLHPNHTYEKVVFDPWRQVTSDVNDTIAPSDAETGDLRTDNDINGYMTEYFKTQPNDWQTWRERRVGNQMGSAERDAAQKAAVHANTPTIAHFDALGRTFLTLADNGLDPAQPGKHVLFATRAGLDIEGNQRDVVDAKDRAVMHYDYDLLGTRIHQASMEAGERWMLNDVTGKPIRLWDSRGFMQRMTYDELRRPTSVFVTENGTERLAERTVYGESLGEAHNHRTRVHRGFDGAGVVTGEDYDFKGNLLLARRELIPDYKQAVNWLQNPVPNAGTFITTMTYDALNRPVMVTTPDKSTYRATFNEANLLDKVDVNVRGAIAATPFVTNIDYNAKGQRELIVYGNGAETTYTYDPLTFRLTNLKTTRAPGQNGLSSPIFKNPTTVQDLHYTYDPVGNVMRIADDALPVTTYDNQQVTPVCVYTHDATYRLTEATGREHIGQTAHDFNPQNRRDYDFVGLTDFIAHPNDLQAMRMYTERYEYDAVGNFQFVRHIAKGDSWSRRYEYDADSLLEPTTRKSNRLTKTTLGNGGTNTETYGYADATGNDVHGCITSMNTMTLAWDCKDQLQRVSLAGGGTAYYVYDASGQRVRKVIETRNGTRKEERIYLGGFEVYREYSGNGLIVKRERETLYVMDDKRRVSLVETKTIDGQAQVLNPTSQIRYQLGNHLGSTGLELDTNGGLISYEEYHPYGTTSFQAMNSAAEVSLKRYRYTGKERDEETGFSYHGARYYAPWIGRWTCCDPVEIKDGVNLYRYVSDNPIKGIDVTGTQETNAHTSNFVPDKQRLDTMDGLLTHLANTRSDCPGTNHHAERSTPVSFSAGKQEQLQAIRRFAQSLSATKSQIPSTAAAGLPYPGKAADLEQIKKNVAAEVIPRDKSSGNPLNDPQSPEHRAKVMQAINYFILSSSDPTKSRLENLTTALGQLTAMRRETEKNSESPILRDVQRYFYGTIGDYLFSNRQDVGTLYKPEQDPGLNQAEFSAKSGEKTLAGVTLAEFADTAYNLEKDFLVSVGKEKWLRTAPDRPASAVGGSSWYAFGRMFHYDHGTDLNTKGVPKLVSSEDLTRFDKQYAKLKQDQIMGMHTIMTTTY